MGFSVLLIICAVLQISLWAGVNSSSEDLSNIHNTDSSNHRHARRLPRFTRGHQIRAKKNPKSILDSGTFLELSKIQHPISIGGEDNHICIRGTCDNVKLEVIKTGDQCKGADKVSGFLVNKDDFEILEWSTWGDVHNGQIEVKPVMICNRLYVTKEKPGVFSLIKRAFKKTDAKTEILTLNTDIKSQHLQIDNYETAKVLNRSKLIKHFKSENRNCKPAKHMLLLDQGSEGSRSSQKDFTLTSGHEWEFSVSGKIPKIDIGVDAKYTVKYEESQMNSETISDLDKVQHSVNTEIEVPPNHSCSVKIISKTVMVQVPYSGQLIREYQNTEKRVTNIADVYEQWEEAELLAYVDPCEKLLSGTKCLNP